MSRNIILFFVCTALLFLGLNYFATKFAPPAPQIIQTPMNIVTSAPTAKSDAVVEAKTPQPVTQVAAAPMPAPSEEALRFDLPNINLDFSWEGGCITEGKLKKYFNNLDKKKNVDLVKNHRRCKIFGFKIGETDLRSAPSKVERVSDREIILTQTANNVEVSRKFNFPDGGYHGHLDVQFKNVGTSPVDTSAGFEMGATSDQKKLGGMLSGQLSEYQGIAYQVDGSVKRKAFPFKDEPKRAEILEADNLSVEWIATGSTYFTTAVLPQFKDLLNINAFATGFNIQANKNAPIDRTVYEAWVNHPIKLAPGETKNFSYDVYLGPRVKSELAKYKGAMLEQSIDYGFFKIVAWPLFYIMEFLHKVFGNWGIAIIVVTFAIKILFYPLYKKSYVAGKRMQLLQPQMTAIREKYKDDKAKQQQELMAFMKTNGANPLSGCLPVLPQMPVFFALYAVLQHTFELRQVPFFGWIQDLSVMDPYYITPVILGLLMFVQQKLTPLPPSVDPAQGKLMQLMPVIFSVMMVTFPSGLVLYMITNTVVSLAQQKYMIRKYVNV